MNITKEQPEIKLEAQESMDNVNYSVARIIKILREKCYLPNIEILKIIPDLLTMSQSDFSHKSQVKGLKIEMEFLLKLKHNLLNRINDLSGLDKDKVYLSFLKKQLTDEPLDKKEKELEKVLDHLRVAKQKAKEL